MRKHPKSSNPGKERLSEVYIQEKMKFRLARYMSNKIKKNESDEK